MQNNLPQNLRERYQQLKTEQPKLRIRNAAQELDVSELELLELQLGQALIRLEGDWTELLPKVAGLGKVMALTRNEYAVHERKGVYDNISFMAGGQMGVAVNPDIDLRFFMTQWKYAYAYTQTNPRTKKPLHGLQFFNDRGVAVHKIYLTTHSDEAAYHQLVAEYRSADQTTVTVVNNDPVETPEYNSDEEVDVPAFQADWLALKDTHDFFPLLKKHKVQRLQALRLAPEGHAFPLTKEAVVELFEKVASSQVPIMIFANSPGCIQIHTGPIKKLFPMEQWFNIMDPDFNLHLNLDGVDQVWVVKKPTADGIVTGIEIYDSEGQMIIYCFGKRKPGIPELEEWRSTVAGLPQIESAYENN